MNKIEDNNTIVDLVPDTFVELFKCPLTNKIFLNPIIVNGTTYEKEAYIKNNSCNIDLVPSIIIRNFINALLEKMPQYKKHQYVNTLEEVIKEREKKDYATNCYKVNDYIVRNSEKIFNYVKFTSEPLLTHSLLNFIANNLESKYVEHIFRNIEINFNTAKILKNCIDSAINQQRKKRFIDITLEIFSNYVMLFENMTIIHILVGNCNDVYLIEELFSNKRINMPDILLLDSKKKSVAEYIFQTATYDCIIKFINLIDIFDERIMLNKQKFMDSLYNNCKMNTKNYEIITNLLIGFNENDVYNFDMVKELNDVEEDVIINNAPKPINNALEPGLKNNALEPELKNNALEQKPINNALEPELKNLSEDSSDSLDSSSSD